ncbi:hypothetical protein FEM48_Zijuj04G0124600 [Ziziphus jujuba var. spinosa]|uniref:Receptor ligand binding region domain-containing protein n=1 Tax=Ziziphus jujuba var. spinosa TaxID=714518 RepID=A0A978VJW0_ZIZJJ|nr:hypothetical protein FEM48_Zijuj04G0124600 [Ziziphus jujuba var. spinosa]
MMNKGCAWFLTGTTMNLLNFVDDTSVIESMQGIVVEYKWYLAYDSLWALAEIVERAWVKLPPRNGTEQEVRSNNYLHDVDEIKSSKHGSVLLEEILKNKMMGISGEFQFENGIRKSPSKAFEKVNVIGKGERRVKVREKSHKGRNLLSPNDLEVILWPGGTTNAPKGTHSLMGINDTEPIRIGFLSTRGFEELVSVYYDHQSNETKFTRFCIDVFKAAIKLLPYQIPYQFIESHPNNSGESTRTSNINYFVQHFNLLMFRKGSPLVRDMSWAIEKLREEGELVKLEVKWFHSKSTGAYEEGHSKNPNAFDLQNFGGLFLISSISLAFALILFLTYVLKQNRHVLKYKFGNLLQYIGWN